MKYILTNENLQQARKILKKYKEHEDSINFKRIRDLIERIFGKNQLGLLGLATRFSYERKQSLNDLSNIFTEIYRNKNLLKNLPKQVVNYKDPEELMDDLTTAKEWATYNKEFVQKLKGSFKKEAREDKELKDAYIGLENDRRKDLVKNFLPKIARYKSFEDFRIAVFNYLSSPDNSQEVVDKINSTKGINVVYHKNGILVAEVFTYDASCKIGSKSWCISTGKNWWETYNSLDSGNKQYFLWNFNVPSTNINSRLGVTIKPDGNPKTAHLKNDQYVNFQNYIDKYGIDKKIFKPLDTNDIDKLIDNYGLNGKILSWVSKKDDGKEILMKHKDRIPKLQAMLLGLLSEDEIENMPEIKSMIYSKEKKPELKQLVITCNSAENIEELKEKNEKAYNIISSMSFLDKLTFVDKYHSRYSYDREPGEYLTDSGVYTLFENDMNSSKYPFEVETDNWSSAILFEFKMDKDKYVENILNTYEEFYYGLININSYDTYYLTSISENEEYNYLDRYFDDKTGKLLKEYFDILKKYIVHEDIIKEIDEFLDKGYSHKDNFGQFMEMIQMYDPKFNYDSYKNNESYFYNFCDKLEDAANDVLQEDIKEWNDKKIGNFAEDRGLYEVNSIEILESINVENISENLTINQWIASNPSDVDKMNFHFYDYPHASTYLGEADNTLANEDLHEKLQDAIDVGILEDEDLEEIKDIVKYEKHLLSNGYEPYVKNDYRDSIYYYALTFKGEGEVVDVEYTVEVEDGDGKIKKEKRTKKEKQDINYIINRSDIEWDGDTWLYILKKPYSYYDKSYYTRFSNMFQKDKKELIKMGIEVKKINIENNTIDHNQLKFKFEGIKNFKSFKQSKLG